MKKPGLTPFSAAAYLTSPEAIAAYLADARASGDPDVIAAALKAVDSLGAGSPGSEPKPAAGEK